MAADSVARYFGARPRILSRCGIRYEDRGSVSEEVLHECAVYRCVLLLFPAKTMESCILDQRVGAQKVIPLATSSIVNSEIGSGLRIFVGFRKQYSARQHAESVLAEVTSRVGGTVVPESIVVHLRICSDANALVVRSAIRSATEDYSPDPGAFASNNLFVPRANFTSFGSLDSAALPNVTVRAGGFNHCFYGHMERVDIDDAPMLRGHCSADQIVPISVSGPDGSIQQRTALVQRLSRHPFIEPIVAVTANTEPGAPLAVLLPLAVQHASSLSTLFPIGAGKPVMVCSRAMLTAVAAQLTLAIAHAHARGVVVGPLLPERIALREVPRKDGCELLLSGGDRSASYVSYASIQLRAVGVYPTNWNLRRKSLRTLAFLTPQYIRQWETDRPGHQVPRWEAADDWWSLGALLYWMRTGGLLLMGIETPLNELMRHADSAAHDVVHKAMLETQGMLVENELSKAATLSGDGENHNWREIIHGLMTSRPAAAHAVTPAEVATLKVLCQVPETAESPVHCTPIMVMLSRTFRDAQVDWLEVFEGKWPVPVIISRKRATPPLSKVQVATTPPLRKRSVSPQRQLLLTLSPVKGTTTST
jgi:hypothetical protein